MLAAIIALGLLSRATHTGFRLIDKYLGDALYAAMVYVLLRLSERISRVALWAAVIIYSCVIQLLELMGHTSATLHSGHTVVRICARLLGTEFSVFDLAGYGVGIGCLAMLDRVISKASDQPMKAGL